jgi:hypothetical protein
MPKIIPSINITAAVLMAAAMLAGAATPSRAESCSIRMHIVTAGFIVGVGGGSGSLSCHGRKAPISIGGIGIGTLVVAAVDLVGIASKVRTPAAVAGTYGAAGAGATVVGGAQVARLQNEKGVVLEVHAVQAGSQVSLSLAGMTIALQ